MTDGEHLLNCFLTHLNDKDTTPTISVNSTKTNISNANFRISLGQDHELKMKLWTEWFISDWCFHTMLCHLTSCLCLFFLEWSHWLVLTSGSCWLVSFFLHCYSPQSPSHAVHACTQHRVLHARINEPANEALWKTAIKYPWLRWLKEWLSFSFL